MTSIFRIVVVSLLLIFSAGALAKSYWATWIVTIALLVVFVLPNSRYPFLEKKRGVIMSFLLIAFFVSLYIG